MEVGTFASPVAVARALPIDCRQQLTPIRIGHGVHLYLAGAHSAHHELQFARKNRESKHVKLRRMAICAQLAESEQQMVEEQEAMSSSSKCVLVVGATGGVGTTLFAFENFLGPPIRFLQVSLTPTSFVQLTMCRIAFGVNWLTGLWNSGRQEWFGRNWRSTIFVEHIELQLWPCAPWVEESHLQFASKQGKRQVQEVGVLLYSVLDCMIVKLRVLRMFLVKFAVHNLRRAFEPVAMCAMSWEEAFANLAANPGEYGLRAGSRSPFCNG